MDMRRFEITVDARNSNVSSRIKRDKQKHLPQGQKLPVYCVPNTEYMNHKNLREKRRMSVETTGIPALRTFDLALAALGVWRSTEDHPAHKIQVLLRGAQRWAQNSPAKRGAGLMAIVKDVQEFWVMKIDLLVEHCNKIVQKDLISKISAGLHGCQNHTFLVLREISDWHQ